MDIRGEGNAYYGVTRGYIEGANEITRSSAKRHPKFMSRVISVILLNRKPCIAFWLPLSYY